jgi:hypothetical protein
MNTETEHEAPMPRNDGAKTERIDLGLALLRAAAPPRVSFSQEDIAAWCGCTPAMIGSIEARALRRLRQKVRARFGLAPSELDNHSLFLALQSQL